VKRGKEERGERRREDNKGDGRGGN